MRAYFFVIGAFIWLSNFAQSDSVSLHFLPIEKKFEFRLDSNLIIIFDKKQSETSCKLNSSVDTLSSFKGQINDSVAIRINNYNITIYKLYLWKNDVVEINSPTEFIRISVEYGKKVIIEKIQNNQVLTITVFDKKGRCKSVKTGDIFNYRIRIMNEKTFYKNCKIKTNTNRIDGNDCVVKYFKKNGKYIRSLGGNYFLKNK